MEVYTCGASMYVLAFFLLSMKTISFTFATSWSILVLEMLIEDCLSLDAAPVPAYWMLCRRQPPIVYGHASWDKEYRHAIGSCHLYTC